MFCCHCCCKRWHFHVAVVDCVVVTIKKRSLFFVFLFVVVFCFIVAVSVAAVVVIRGVVKVGGVSMSRIIFLRINVGGKLCGSSFGRFA